MINSFQDKQKTLLLNLYRVQANSKMIDVRHLLYNVFNNVAKNLHSEFYEIFLDTLITEKRIGQERTIFIF